MNLKSLCLAVFALVACGPADPGPTTTTSSQQCREDHECINGSCHCKSGPRNGSSCVDPSFSSGSSACDVACRWCT